MNWDILWGRPHPGMPLDIHDVPFPIHDLDPALEDLRVAVISDLHFGRFVDHRWTRCLAERLLQAKPDLIVLTGDMIDCHRSKLHACAKALSQLTAPLGVLACLGNHDYYVGAADTRKELAAVGIDVLVNQHRRITHNGATFIVAGLDEHKWGRPDLAKALSGVNGECPTLLLCHNPDHADHIDGTHRVDIMLSGHSHGGQVRPWGHPVTTRLKNRKYCAGLAQGPHCHVYTSRGVGVTALPLRINCPPEAPIIRLHRTNQTLAFTPPKT